MSAVPWIILLAPLIAAAVILVVGQYSRALSAGLAIASAVLGCVLSWWVFFQPDAEVAGFAWLDFSGILSVPIGATIDSLSKVMLVVVTSIASLVFIYSTAYMAHEEGYWRYFAGLSLFLFSMLGIVLANNFVMLFIFWELVGVSSYILIGHYYSKDSAANASKQAFLVNRIGDFGLMLGILMLWSMAGSVVFTDMFEKSEVLRSHGLYFGVACILVFCGTVGKSAQLPLHVWLPNSMEGPTPVSSLLHAATMVAAGVFMLARIYPLLLASQMAMTVIAWVGGLTCFVAGLMAVQQDDIKRILAYSTISQLGYMVLGVGVAQSAEAPMFHLFTHACFKCLLFLTAGSVIVGMHHEQDIWKMGSLKNKMPLTFLFFCAGALALVGFPFTSGYYSKDLLIELTLANHDVPGSTALFWIAAAAVALTGFYMARMYMVVFWGAPRSDEAKHAGESPAVMIIPMAILALASISVGWPFISHIFFADLPHPHDLPWFAKPATLGFLALGAGSALLIYRGAPAKDPINIPAFANRLYIDDFYAWLVKNVQDGAAWLSGWADRWIVDLLVVRIPSNVTWLCGFVMRSLQLGNIQAYTFFFAAGMVGLIYLLIAR